MDEGRDHRLKEDSENWKGQNLCANDGPKMICASEWGTGGRDGSNSKSKCRKKIRQFQSMHPSFAINGLCGRRSVPGRKDGRGRPVGSNEIYIIIQLDQFYYCQTQGRHFPDGPLTTGPSWKWWPCWFTERAIMIMMALSGKFSRRTQKGGKFKH